MKTVTAIIATTFVLVVLILANAPPPDGAVGGEAGPPVPIQTVFAALEAENDAARRLWAGEIVGTGGERGLRFDKDWHEEGIDAGPLPALFLRETAEYMRRHPAPLYLFLGSDFPINEANRFTGLQTEHFAEIRRTGEPQFFQDPEFGFHTAMFSDVASAEACVVCHNDDPGSPRKDWRVGEIMGATTWSYPEGEVSLSTALTLVGVLRQSIREAYQHYLEKVTTFAKPPPVGDRWPADGYFLPSADVFLSRVEQTASANTLKLLLDAQAEAGTAPTDRIKEDRGR